MNLSSYERQVLYHQHRLRVMNAKSVIDSQPPVKKSREAHKELSFLELMASMGSNTNGKDFYRTFTKTPEALHSRPRIESASNINSCLSPPSPYQQPLFNQLHRQRTFERAGSNQDVTAHTVKKREESKKKFTYNIPDYVIQRYEHLTPQNMAMLRKLLRPKIFMDLEVKNMRPLGRITIQLFTEACPEVVLEFVRACKTQNKDRLNFTRLFAPLWLEGELALEDSTALTSFSIEHDMNALDHGSGAGVLSFPSRYVRGSKRRFLSFSISFKPLNVLNGKRIAFGKVRRGGWVLDVIQDLGTKNGKPTKEIIVRKCGLLQ